MDNHRLALDTAHDRIRELEGLLTEKDAVIESLNAGIEARDDTIREYHRMMARQLQVEQRENGDD